MGRVARPLVGPWFDEQCPPADNLRKGLNTSKALERLAMTQHEDTSASPADRVLPGHTR